MKLVNASEMRAVDDCAINERGLPSLDLMENAGRGIFEYLQEAILPESKDSRIIIICGRGNNGGDGFVVGRHLVEDGYPVDFLLVGADDKLSADCRTNYDRVVRLGRPVIQLKEIGDIPDLSAWDIIIDAVFGTGFSGIAEGMAAEVIEKINAAEKYVVAIDAPSGLDVSTGMAEGAAVVADVTATLALPKPGLFISPGRELAGVVVIIPIGIPDEVVDSFAFKTNLLTDELVADLLPTPTPDGHKGDFGKVFILAGSPGLTGAACLAGKAAARSGAGLVTVGLPASLNPILEVKLTEVMTCPLPEIKKRGVLALRARGDIRRCLADKDAVAIGPGIGRHHETRELVRRLLADIDVPMVIDADGLFALSGEDTPLASAHGPLVLTPHPGEFARLTGVTPEGNPVDNYALVLEYARKYDAVIVLKGSPTIVGSPEGQVYLNPTGNYGMASGGSGDVLTGIITAFLGQQMSPLEAALGGVYIHGLAGDLAIESINPRSLVAGDLITSLSEAFEVLESY